MKASSKGNLAHWEWRARVQQESAAGWYNRGQNFMSRNDLPLVIFHQNMAQTAHELAMEYLMACIYGKLVSFQNIDRRTWL